MLLVLKPLSPLLLDLLFNRNIDNVDVLARGIMSYLQHLLAFAFELVVFLC